MGGKVNGGIEMECWQLLQAQKLKAAACFFFIACFTFALAVERDKQCVIFLGCFMTFY